MQASCYTGANQRECLDLTLWLASLETVTTLKRWLPAHQGFTTSMQLVAACSCPVRQGRDCQSWMSSRWLWLVGLPADPRGFM